MRPPSESESYMNPKDFAMSLDLINRHYQEPNRNRFESKYFWEELYPLIATAGFASIEIPYEPVWQFGGRSGVPMNRYCINTKYTSAAQYREVLAKSGIERVAGVSFDPNLFMRNDNVHFYFGASGHFAGEALAHAADLGADYFAISPSPYYGRIKQYHPDIDTQIDNFTDRTVELLTGLAKRAEELGVKLVLRNEYWSLFGGERVLTLLARLPEGVSIDVDTASLAVGGLALADFLATNIRRVGCVHLTDTVFVDHCETWKTPNPEHPQGKATQVFRDPGTGSVDFAGAVTLLDKLGYSGPVVCSARQTRDPFRALLRTRALLNQLQN